MFDENMSDEEEEGFDDLEGLTERMKKSNNATFQVSGWENDTDGILEEMNPHESPDKELLWAAENGRLDIIKSILEKDVSLLDTTVDADGYTPLHRACYSDNPDIVKYLLQKGARHDARTNDNWHPLHSACKWNSIRCAKLLIARGADINATSEGGITPLHLVAEHPGSDTLLKLFLSHPELETYHKNTVGDTAYQIAYRSGPHYIFFEAIEPCFR